MAYFLLAMWLMVAGGKTAWTHAVRRGFGEIADWFETLAKAEKSHAGRFQKALDIDEHNQTYKQRTIEAWINYGDDRRYNLNFDDAGTRRVYFLSLGDTAPVALTDATDYGNLAIAEDGTATIEAEAWLTHLFSAKAAAQGGVVRPGDRRLIVVTLEGAIYCFGPDRIDAKTYDDTKEILVKR